MKHLLFVTCYTAEHYVNSFIEKLSKLSVKFYRVIFYNNPGNGTPTISLFVL